MSISGWSSAHREGDGVSKDLNPSPSLRFDPLPPSRDRSSSFGMTNTPGTPGELARRVDSVACTPPSPLFLPLSPPKKSAVSSASPSIAQSMKSDMACVFTIEKRSLTEMAADLQKVPSDHCFRALVLKETPLPEGNSPHEELDEKRSLMLFKSLCRTFSQVQSLELDSAYFPFSAISDIYQLRQLRSITIRPGHGLPGSLVKALQGHASIEEIVLDKNVLIGITEAELQKDTRVSLRGCVYTE